jgi:uncharacterized protein
MVASIHFLENAVQVDHSKELVFAGDGVRLAGQIDYPTSPLPQNGYPLIFILHHVGWNSRSCYQHFADIGLASGFAVFRWDQRGTGRSGAGGRGSTTQDAVHAYEVALDQPDINRRRVIIVAQGTGTALLGSSFGLFARLQRPYGVALVANRLDEKAVLAIDTRLQIVVGQDDWNPWQRFGQAASASHNAAYKHGAFSYVAPNTDQTLMDVGDDGQEAFHNGAATVIKDWLRSLCPPSRSI